MKYRDPETGQFKDLKVKTSDTLPIGTQVAYGGTVPPTGWLICDGSAVSRTTYAELFKVIGTSYGAGDGSTTFNLPNKKGRVSAGYDSTNSKFNAIGKKLGEETHTLTAQELASHNHSGTTDLAGEHTHTSKDYYDVLYGQGTQRRVVAYGSTTNIGDTVSINNAGSHQHTFTTNNTGGNQPHNNVQPTEVDNWIIKAFQSIAVVGKVVNTKTNSDNDTYSCNYLNEIGSCACFSKTDSQNLAQYTRETILFNTTDYVDNECFKLQPDGTIKVLKDISRVQVNFNIRINGGNSTSHNIYCLSTSDEGFNISSNIDSEALSGSGILKVKQNDIISLIVYSGSAEANIDGYSKQWCSINLCVIK